MRRIFFLFFISVLSTLPAWAQTDEGKTILVLDASGSMWGQLDGQAKITIAQTVISGLLKDLPLDQQLGLTAYGHNRKGDCTDIETLVQPGADTRQAIHDAVMAIKPKGKTPLSAAVLQAAQALKYEENKATVILVSDGRETCDFDPCAVGRQLEEAGVDFTAHVVGFDVSNTADQAQLQCLAENTGGQFLTASSASELSEALKSVSIPKPPAPAKITFRVVEEKTNRHLTQDLIWDLANAETGEVLSQSELAETLSQELLPGKYTVQVLRTTDETTAELTVTTGPSRPNNFVLTLPKYLPRATVLGPETGVVGATIPVEWTGPNEKRDYVVVAVPETPSNEYINYQYTKEGSPLLLELPPTPGNYELRYIHKNGGDILARQPISVTPASATITAPLTAMAGEDLKLEWTGPDYKQDFISVAKPDADPNKYLNYAYTRKGSPTRITMPPEPGTYELRYTMRQRTTVIARHPIIVGPVVATLIAPDTAQAGEILKIEWTGPDYNGDYLSIARIDTDDGKYENYAYTRKGSPAKLLMPAKPGDYEIRYVMRQKSTVLTRHPISISEVGAGLTIPQTAKIGAPLKVEWQGPDYQSDFISVARPDDPGGKYIAYTYTRKGSPLRLKMPSKPGDYEVRYIQKQDHTILASQTIQVEEIQASLTAQEAAHIGEHIKLNWTGPDYERDFLAIARPDAEDHKYINYTYTRKGEPLRLVMPSRPGAYEIRYVMKGNPDRVIARLPIAVTKTTATLTPRGEAVAGETLVLEWTGPDTPRDFIGIGLPGKDKYLKYTATRQGTPLRLKLPEMPGMYELRYYLHEGSTIITRIPLEVK